MFDMKKRGGTHVADELALATRFRRHRVALALLYRLPFPCDDDKRLGTIFGNAGLDKPAADDGSGTADPAAAMYGRLSSSALVVCQNGHDASNEVRVRGNCPVWDREVVVLHFARVDAKSGHTLIELRRVR